MARCLAFLKTNVKFDSRENRTNRAFRMSGYPLENRLVQRIIEPVVVRYRKEIDVVFLKLGKQYIKMINITFRNDVTVFI